MISTVLTNAAELFKTNLKVLFKDKELPVSAIQHGGQFSDAEIEKIQISQPSVLLTVLNWERMKSSTQLEGRPYKVNFAAVLVAVGGSPEQRREQLVALAMKVTQLLENQRWDLSDKKITAAEMAVSRNLYSPAAQQRGLSLWAVTWSHEMKGMGITHAPTLYRLHEMQTQTDLHGSLDNTPEIEGSTLPGYGDLNPEPAP